MLKRILASLLATCILAGLFTVVAFADSTWQPQKAVTRIGDNYTYSNVTYYNSQNTEITTPEAGNITAKIKIKSETETAPVFFAVICYQNDKLSTVGIDTTPAAITPAGVDYEATVNVASATNAKLVTVLWKNSKDMVPVCPSAISTNSDARLSYLSVDNGTLNFDIDTTEYVVVLEDALAAKAPYITCSTVDNGATVEISDPKRFPGEAKIKVTASDGVTTKEYTIKYTVAENVKLAEPYNFVSPSGGSFDSSKIYLERDLKVGSFIISNRADIPLSHVDETLVGLDYITTAHPDAGSLNSYDIKMIRGGKVHVLFKARFYHGEIERRLPASEGWVIDTSGWDRGVENTWPNEDGTYGDRVTFDADGNVIATDGIVNNIPVDMDWNTDKEVWRQYHNSIYDVRTQGWVYVNWRNNVESQGYRQHDWGALGYKGTKEVAKGQSVTISWLAEGWGTFVVLEYDEWIPNDYTVF